MRRLRWPIAILVLVATLVLAYVLRDLIYQLLVVPLAYTLWWGGLVYRAIPQLIKWIVLLVTLGLIVVWRLIPDVSPPSNPKLPRRTLDGRLESLAVGIQRARTSNYFKWQLANRLGRLDRRIADSAGALPGASESLDPVHQYLSAGLSQSFVDFPTPRGLFARRQATPLDIDPEHVIAYLESRMEHNDARRTRSL